MWKTPGHFWAQIGPFPHILAPKTAEIRCAAVDLALFRKLKLVILCAMALLTCTDPYNEAEDLIAQAMKYKHEYG